ncbi:hypothetical protein GPROT1_00436 [Gammaproteobacteria bacterium]|nr:hypothetical protein GPROT1_00436 [Gammaproteobacteria bacterium]
MRNFVLLLSFAAVFLLGGCATSPFESPTPISVDDPKYFIDVLPTRPPVVSRDGFDAGLTFTVIAERPMFQEYLVQELTQTLIFEYRHGGEHTESFTLVECFHLRYTGETQLGARYELQRGQYDRHFYTGLSELSEDVVAVRLERTISAYVAHVEGADFTARGFAQLDSNESGDVVSNSPSRFNENYQKKHETRGQPKRSNRAGGVTYKLDYRLERMGLGKAEFELTRAKGSGRVFQPSLVMWR